MPLVPEVVMVEVRRFEGSGGAFLLVHAVGNVPTSGWSGLRLSPRYDATPPADGRWDFDFQADPPSAPVLEVVLAVSVEGVFAAPEWARDVRVHAGNNSLSATEFEPARAVRSLAHRFEPIGRQGAALVRQDLASFDENPVPIGFGASFDHIEMKKLRHTLSLTIEGPDSSAIHRRLVEATAMGLVANIARAHALGGGALYAAISALLARLQRHLGDAFDVRIDDRTDWIACRA